MSEELPAGLIDALLRGRRVVLAAAAPDKGMKTLSLLCAFGLFCLPKAHGQTQPAFRLIEGASDRAYDFARVNVAGAALPVSFTRALKAAPLKDSAPDFERRLQENEAGFLLRLQGSRQALEGRPRQWQAWVGREQAAVAADALGKTLRERYQLNFFQKFVEDLASGRGRRDPAALTAAGLAGGAFAYIGGVHASFTVGRLKMGIDLRPGFKIARAARTGCAEHIGDLRLAFKDSPLSLSTQYGMAGGRARAERVGLDYNLRF